ncbi:MAG: DUF1631 family protein [Gammaproteobacteria bacterium]|nr:MAG: DUF1631 family protein [Gammaproteobacteria bacterium]
MQDFLLTYQQASRPFVAFATDVCGRLLTQANTLLTELASKASGAEQTRYQKDIQVLQSIQKALPLAFGKRMANKFDRFWAGEDLSEQETLNAQPEDLSKEIVRTVDCLTNHVAEPLWHLNMRLALLRGGRKTADYGNPMGPAQFCGALCAELGTQTASPRLQLLLFRLIEKHLPDRLAVFYTDTNQQLVSAGIFPHLRYYLLESNSGGKSDDPISAFDKHAILSAEDNEKEAQIHVTAMVRSQVNHREAPLRQTALGTSFGRMETEGRGGADTVNEVDIVFAIVALTTKYPVPRGRVYRPVPPIAKLEELLIEHLSKAGEHSGRRRMKRLMAEALSRMGRIFDVLLDDHYLGVEQRDLLSHLYLPMVKLGMLEGRFWTDPNHVGRRLFGLLCELAEFWVAVPQNDRTTYPQLHAVAERLTRDYIDDLSVVEAILEDLEGFALRIGQRASMTLGRTIESERGLAKVSSAQVFAAEQAHAVLSSEQVPEVIRESLQDPLMEFLSGLLLRLADKGETAIADASEAILSAMPVAGASATNALAGTQKKLEQDLLAAGGHSQSVQKLLKAFEDAVQRWQGLEGMAGKKARTGMQGAKKGSGTDPLAGLPGQGFGLWFAATAPEQAVPALWLLVWASPSPRRYLFVNRLGVRGDMLDEEALRQQLGSGRLQPLVGHGNPWVRALRESSLKAGH